MLPSTLWESKGSSREVEEVHLQWKSAQDRTRHQQQTPSQVSSSVVASAQAFLMPLTTVDTYGLFPSSMSSDPPLYSGASTLQTQHPSQVSENVLKRWHAVSQQTALLAGYALHEDAAAVTQYPLKMGTNVGSTSQPNAPPAELAELENPSGCAQNNSSSRWASSDDHQPRLPRQILADRRASFFTSLSLRLSSSQSSLSPAPEGCAFRCTPPHSPTVSLSLDEDVDFDRATQGRVEFASQLCDGIGDNDNDGVGEQVELGRSSVMPRPSAQPHLRPSVHLSTKAANYELVAAANVSTPPPPPPPSSTFQEPRNSTTELDECHAYAVASVGGADSSRGTSMHSGNSSNCKKHGLPRASSGHGLTSLSQSQGKGYSESPPQPPQQPPFISSHLPAQLWTSTARVAGVDDVAAIRSSHHHHGYQQSFQTSRHSPPSLSQYPGGAISKPTTVVGPTLSARSVYTSSVSSHSVSSGHYSMNVTPPPSGSAHTFMLLPSSLENSVTGSSTHAMPHHHQQHQQQQQQQPPYCGYAMQVPVQSLPPSEVASASLYASSHSSGAMLSPSTMQSSSHATMAPGGGVDAVTLFYVGAPTALNGLPLMAAHSQVNTSPASSTSAQSCSFNVTPFSLPDSSALSSHYVYVQPYPPANHLQSLPLSLQQYTGHFASQLPNVGTAAAAASEQAASSSAHGRMSSAAGESAMAYLPHVTSTKSPPVSQQSGLTYPSIRPVCLSTNPELTRKQVNVHGAMLNVLPYYPYNENAPPAPTVHIVTGLGSLNNSIPTQPLAASRWSAQSANNNAESNPDLNWRSLDGVRGQGAGVISSCAHAGDMPALANAPVLPIFIQMFPCELRDRVGLLNRVIEMTCGRDAGVVQGFETRSETSFVAQVRTNKVWDLIYKLRCRVLMDRFGFWYAGDIDQYVRMKEYCEGVRRLPQQTRHFQTDGLPCMPLVVELSRSVDRSFLTENTAPRCFDEIVPIAAVDRHRARLQGLSSVQSSHASGGVSGGMAMATNGASPAGNAVCFTGVGGDSRSLPEGSPVSLTNEIHPMSGSPDNGYRAAGCSAPTLYADPQFLALSQGSGSKGKS